MRIHRNGSVLPPVSRSTASKTTSAQQLGRGPSVDAFEAAPAPVPYSSSRPMVSRGDAGASVSAMQQLLAQQGFDPGPIDGDFGAGTEAALIAFQEANGLDADGVCGPMTWAALEGSVFETPQVSATTEVGSTTSDPLRARIVELAQAEVGTMEETGNNDGPVLKYPEFFGRGSEPYCADFVSWVYTQAGNPIDFAYVPYLQEHLEANGKWKGKADPQPGDIVIFDWDGDGEGDHVGLVKSVLEDGSIETIEGNTSADDRLSDSATLESGVWNRVRSLDDILGFGNP